MQDNITQFRIVQLRILVAIKQVAPNEAVFRDTVIRRPPDWTAGRPALYYDTWSLKLIGSSLYSETGRGNFAISCY
jgi:hypothetical protein